MAPVAPLVAACHAVTSADAFVVAAGAEEGATAEALGSSGGCELLEAQDPVGTMLTRPELAALLLA